jgi:hypothetical protein
MSKLTRRQLIAAGAVAAAGAGGLAVAAKMAHRYGLVPPDSGGIYGPGETLTYGAQRLLTTHSLAREFFRGARFRQSLCRMKSRRWATSSSEVADSWVRRTGE